MWNPLSWVMEIAAIMAIVLDNGGVSSILLSPLPSSVASEHLTMHGCISQGEPPDWQDFIGIVVLLIINSTISFIEENNAGNAAAALMAGLAPKTKVSLRT